MHDRSPKKSAWINVDSWNVHSFFAKKGILVCKPITVNDDKFVSEKSLILGAQPNQRNMSCDIAKLPVKNKLFYDAFNKSFLSFNEKLFHQQLDSLQLNSRDKKKIKIDTIIQLIVDYIEADIIVNTKRTEEVFFRLTFSNSQSIYVYPWFEPKELTFNLSIITRFVTAGCIFGAGLMGDDQHGNTFYSVINHHIEFFPGQQIATVYYDENASNAYDNYLLIEFKKLIQFINSKNMTGKKEIIYHFPYYDYLLFGIQLHIHNKISQQALNQFCKLIYMKKISYSKVLLDLCEVNDISITILSPFENLFFKFFEKYGMDDNLGDKLLEHFKLDGLKVTPTKEVEFVDYCLTVLNSKEIKEENKESLHLVWNDFLEADEMNSRSAKPSTIKRLLEIANAVVIGVAARGNINIQVCSWLPLTEKQIQLGYTEFKKYLPELYPSVLNITYLDSVISYNKYNHGRFFYQGKNLESQKELLRKWEQLTHQDNLSELSDADIISKLGMKK